MTIEAVCHELEQIFRYDPEKVIKVYIGVNGDNIDNTGLKSKEHSVVSVILHKNWNTSDFTVADIALIKLKTKVEFTLNNRGFNVKKNSILPGKVIIEKSRGGRFLWNRN